MGKNAAHKAQQRARHTGGADEPGAAETGDGTVDASFHSPAWHAARIAALTTERVSWEDFKKQQKEAAGMEAAAAADEAEQMRKYRAQLDADRAARLAKGTNHAHFRESADGQSQKKRKHGEDGEDSRHGKEKKARKVKEQKKHKERKRKDAKKKAKKDRKEKSKSADES